MIPFPSRNMVLKVSYKCLGTVRLANAECRSLVHIKESNTPNSCWVECLTAKGIIFIDATDHLILK